ncbi:MAG: hypothetical protein LBH00_03780 [Planctomycetaceae bacterium]|jgi:hypothetical protein|nr:hypothetical protein [Planctomycetaceae bacterium]
MAKQQKIEQDTDRTAGQEQNTADIYAAKIDELVQLTESLKKERDAAILKQTKLETIAGLQAAARQLKIPEHVITTDLLRYADDCVLDNGKVKSAANADMDAVSFLQGLQAERPHWQPVSAGSGATSNSSRPENNRRSLGQALTAAERARLMR